MEFLCIEDRGIFKSGVPAVFRCLIPVDRRSFLVAADEDFCGHRFALVTV